MRRFMTKAEIARFLPHQEGTTAIEYAVIAAGVSVAILGALTTLGTQVMTVFYDKLSTLF